MLCLFPFYCKDWLLADYWSDNYLLNWCLYHLFLRNFVFALYSILICRLYALLYPLCLYLLLIYAMLMYNGMLCLWKSKVLDYRLHLAVKYHCYLY